MDVHPLSPGPRSKRYNTPRAMREAVLKMADEGGTSRFRINKTESKDGFTVFYLVCSHKKSHDCKATKKVWKLY